VFWALIFLLTLSILINLWFYWERWSHLHSLKERDRERYGLRSDVGRVLAVLGGVTTLIAQILPWVGFRPTSACPGCGGYGASGLIYEGGAIILPLFGLFWLTFFAVPRKVAAILGVIWGAPAFLLSVGALAIIPGPATYVEYGAYMSIVGSLALIGGSGFAFMEAHKIRSPIPLAETPPSMR